MDAATNDTLFGRMGDEELQALTKRFPWFVPARVELRRRTGREDGLLKLAAAYRTLPDGVVAVEGSALAEVSQEELIDRFLEERDLRIVAEEGEPDGEIVTEAQLDEEDDLVSEELAQIYLAQGLREQAIDTYRKLSLRNPEKSIYFAELIADIASGNSPKPTTQSTETEIN